MRCGHIKWKDLDTAQWQKGFSVSIDNVNIIENYLDRNLSGLTALYVLLLYAYRQRIKTLEHDIALKCSC